jgi:hypothetical protein
LETSVFSVWLVLYLRYFSLFINWLGLGDPAHTLTCFIFTNVMWSSQLEYSRNFLDDIIWFQWSCEVRNAPLVLF